MSEEDTNQKDKPTMKDWFYKNTLSLLVCIGMIIILGFMMNSIVKLVIGTQENPSQINIQIVESKYNINNWNKDMINFNKTELYEENFKVEKLFFDVKDLVLEQWKIKSDGFTYKVAAIIAATTIFFAVLVVIIGLFQYLKTKQFEDQIKEQEKAITTQKRELIEVMKATLKTVYFSEAKTLSDIGNENDDIYILNKSIEKLEDVDDIEKENDISEIKTHIENQMKKIKALNYNNIGILKYKKEDYRGALSCFNNAIKLDGINSIYYNNRGKTNHKLEQYKKAMLDYDKAIQRDNDNSEYYNNKGLTNNALGEQEKAILDYDRAIRLDDKASYYNNRGLSKYDIAKMEDQIMFYNRTRKNAEYHSNRAIEYYKDSMTDYEQAINLDDAEAEYYNNLGDAKYYYGEYKYEYLDYYRGIEGEFFEEGRYNYHMQGYYSSALDNYNEALKLDSSNEEYRENQNRAAEIVSKIEEEEKDK